MDDERCEIVELYRDIALYSAIDRIISFDDDDGRRNRVVVRVVEEVGRTSKQRNLGIQPHMYLVSIDLGSHVTQQMKSSCFGEVLTKSSLSRSQRASYTSTNNRCRIRTHRHISENRNSLLRTHSFPCMDASRVAPSICLSSFPEAKRLGLTPAWMHIAPSRKDRRSLIR